MDRLPLVSFVVKLTSTTSNQAAVGSLNHFLTLTIITIPLSESVIQLIDQQLQLAEEVAGSMEQIKVPKRLQFDVEKLRVYLEQRLPGFVCNKGQLSVGKFK